MYERDVHEDYFVLLYDFIYKLIFYINSITISVVRMYNMNVVLKNSFPEI